MRWIMFLLAANVVCGDKIHNLVGQQLQVRV